MTTSSWKYVANGAILSVADPAASLEPHLELIRDVERPQLLGPSRAEVHEAILQGLAANVDESSWDCVGEIEIWFLREGAPIHSGAPLGRRHIDDLRAGDLHPIGKAAVLAYSEYRKPHRERAFANQARKGFPGKPVYPLNPENALALGLLLPRHDEILIKLRWEPGVVAPSHA